MKRLFFAKHLPVPVMLALLLLSTGWAHAQSRTPDCYVLSVGVDNYQKIKDLQGCVADARNTVAAFQAQRGKYFGAVRVQTLVDQDATHSRILQGMQNLTRLGASGDVVVLFLSGHGGRANNNQSWYFTPHDFDSQNFGATALTDRQILDAADVLVTQGKTVLVVVDACYSGQLRTSAQSYLAKYSNPQGGGLALLLSSTAEQTSMALGKYSAFAKAFADSMSVGDFDRDGKITIAEIRRYASDNANELIKQHGQSGKQDSVAAWAPAILVHMPLALTKQVASNTPTKPAIVAKPTPLPPATQATVPVWAGSESLEGFGRLSFQFHEGGRAVMHDAAGATEGSWSRNGNTITLRFANGRIVYTGELRGQSIIGEARNDRTSWTFSVSHPS